MKDTFLTVSNFSFKVLGSSLPEKHDQIVECDVPSRQRKVYEKTFTSCNTIMHSDENNGMCVVLPSMLLLPISFNFHHGQAIFNFPAVETLKPVFHLANLFARTEKEAT